MYKDMCALILSWKSMLFPRAQFSKEQCALIGLWVLVAKREGLDNNFEVIHPK